MKEGLIKDTYELIIKELQTVVTASYIIAVGIGMLFNYQKYSEFGINIFDYADVFDFLIAPFSDFYILLFAAASILIMLVIIKFDTLWRDKWPRTYSKASFGLDKKRWFKYYRNTLFLIGFLLYLYGSADYYGRYTNRKTASSEDITIRLTNDEIKTGKLIGKTKSVVFLLENGRVSALPMDSSVLEIQILR